MQTTSATHLNEKIVFEIFQFFFFYGDARSLSLEFPARDCRTTVSADDLQSTRTVDLPAALQCVVAVPPMPFVLFCSCLLLFLLLRRPVFVRQQYKTELTLLLIKKTTIKGCRDRRLGFSGIGSRLYLTVKECVSTRLKTKCLLNSPLLKRTLKECFQIKNI